MFLEIDPCLPLLTQIYRYNVHRICLLLCHNNFNGTRWKLKFIIKGHSKVSKIKGHSKVSKIYSSPVSPLLSFTLKETSQLCYNGLQTLWRRLLHLHETRRHRPTREERPL